MATEEVDTNKPDSVDAYIGQFPIGVQEVLRTVRAHILTAVPSCVEGMAYGMPAYKFRHKPLIYFAAYSHHLGLYATPSAQKAFAEKLKGLKQGKGSVQFPLNRPIPYLLIAEMAQFKATEILSQ